MGGGRPRPYSSKKNVMLSIAEPEVAVGKHLYRVTNSFAATNEVGRICCHRVGEPRNEAVEMLAYGDLRFGCAQHDVF